MYLSPILNKQKRKKNRLIGEKWLTENEHLHFICFGANSMTSGGGCYYCLYVCNIPTLIMGWLFALN